MARTALLIAGKDLRQRLRDRSALLVAIVVPLVLASIFGLIFHDVDRRPRRVQVRPSSTRIAARRRRRSSRRSCARSSAAG